MIALHRIPAAALLAGVLLGAAAVCRADGRSAYRFSSTSQFSGWQPVGPQGNAIPQDAPGVQAPPRAPFDPGAPGGSGVHVDGPCSGPIRINLMPTKVHYQKIVGAEARSADITCWVSACIPLAVFLDEHRRGINASMLPQITRFGGRNLRPADSGKDRPFIPIDWAVKSVTGSEYSDYTPGLRGDWAGAGGRVAGLYWVFDRSLPGSVAFKLRNTIHTSPITPPGYYGQSFRIATSPIP